MSKSVSRFAHAYWCLFGSTTTIWYTLMTIVPCSAQFPNQSTDNGMDTLSRSIRGHPPVIVKYGVHPFMGRLMAKLEF